MKRIGIVHYRVGRTDGVSLEIEKRKQVLEGMGCEVALIAGPVSTGADFVIPELEFDEPEIARIKRNAFDYFDDRSLSDEELTARTNGIADEIQRSLATIAARFPTSGLLVHNLFSHGRHLPAASAMSGHLNGFPQPVLATHHDHFWERPEYEHPRNEWVSEYLHQFVPPANQDIHHCCINSLAAEGLMARRQIRSSVVPDVFDFQQPAWVIDDFNVDFPAAVDVRPQDVVVLQATRIVRRKAIELAVDLVVRLNDLLPGVVGQRLYNGKRVLQDSRVVLVLAGYAEESARDYLEQLKKKIEGSGIEVRFASDLISAQRLTRPEKQYALWDAYAHADIVTYPSLQEGWGNQFIEAVFARKPVVLLEYPVFEADIRQEGYAIISMGSHSEVVYNNGLASLPPSKIEDVARQAVDSLLQVDLNSVLEKNAEIGERYHGLHILESLFEKSLG